MPGVAAQIPPRLVFDARWLRTGIGRYTLSVLKGLRGHIPDIETVCITQPQHKALIAGLCDRVIEARQNIYTVQEQLVLPWIARGASAFYAPHYNIPVLWRRQLLVTIHDLTHLIDATYRGNWKSRLYAKPLVTLAVKRADCIVTPSEYTRRMLHQHLQVSPERVTVIPGAISETFQPQNKAMARSQVAREHGITRPYLLYVGSLRPSKNVPLLLDALDRLHQKRHDAPALIIVGNDGGRMHEVKSYASTLKLENTVFWLKGLTDISLATLYSGAVMTILPSFEEGFGFPVIESMACGTPVICSAAASLPEVAGDASLYFSPYSSAELSDTIERLMDSTSEQQRLTSAGFKRAQRYSQHRSGLLQAGIIRKLLSC
jgi:glycosyltransferase involved in cell wall biosynthesis